jgi:FlaA1/EpsC-like NDP-sugar epimerase
MSWQLLNITLNRLRRHRQTAVLLIDCAVVALCWNVTYVFRLGFERWLSARPVYDGWVLIGLIALYALVFLAMSVPKGLWRFSGFGEIKRLTLACLLAGSLGAAVVMALQLQQVPRAVLALHPVIALMGLTLARIAYRMLYEHMRSRIAGRADVPLRRALILGAGNAARRLLAGIQHQGWLIVGLLDDDPLKQGARISGVPVLGRLADVYSIVQQCKSASDGPISHLILAMPTATPAQRRRVINEVTSTRLPMLTVPSSQELQQGSQRVRDIEPEDLLGREPVQLDEAGIQDCIQDHMVMITGAGGSIGSELCRQVARFHPAGLVLFELSEFNLYAIEQELSERHPKLPLIRVLGDVKDPERLRQVLAQHRPQVIFHAAAYKHVPLVEENPWAALHNNTLGTWNMAQAAAAAGVARFVLISTDKAVNPTSVMGATKRAAEILISHLAREQPGTRFMAVRFGNVLGSSGSVIPKFKEQIAKGGPITVTHPEMTRYFMTIPEAARLVVQAGAMGETGQVFVLDMGEPVKIIELARDLIRLSGHQLEQIQIQFTGLRPGEKLYEELLADDDTSLPTSVECLRIARLNDDLNAADIQNWLAQSQAMGPDCLPQAVRAQLKDLVPEFVNGG